MCVSYLLWRSGENHSPVLPKPLHNTAKTHHPCGKTKPCVCVCPYVCACDTKRFIEREEEAVRACEYVGVLGVACVVICSRVKFQAHCWAVSGLPAGNLTLLPSGKT